MNVVGAHFSKLIGNTITNTIDSTFDGLTATLTSEPSFGGNRKVSTNSSPTHEIQLLVSSQDLLDSAQGVIVFKNCYRVEIRTTIIDGGQFLANKFDKSKSMGLSILNSFGPLLLETVAFTNLRPLDSKVLLTNSIITFYRSLVSYYLISDVSFTDISMHAGEEALADDENSSPHLIQGDLVVY